MLLYLALLLPAAVYIIWTHGLKNFLIDQTTALLDLDHPEFGKDRTGKKIPGTAVICGGSMAGLLTARILACHYEQVVIVETEALPILTRQVSGGKGENKRTRIQQYLAPHLFLSLTVYALRRLFSDFDKVAKEVGGSVHDLNHDFVVGGVKSMYVPNNGMTVLTMSRDGLEPLLRRLILKNPNQSNITVVNGTITGLDQRKGSNRITSVNLRHADGKMDKLDVALFVDASGPSAVGKAMLRKLPSPISVEMSTYDPGVSYRGNFLDLNDDVAKKMNASGVLAGGPQATWEEVGFLVISVANFVEGERGGIITGKVDGNRFIYYLTHSKSDPDPESLPKTMDEFITLLENQKGISDRSIRIVKELWRIVKEDDPAQGSEVLSIRYAECFTNHYDVSSQSVGFPSNFLALGDSYMRLNPAYGSGTTKIALEAITLYGILRRATYDSLTGPNCKLSRDFFEKQSVRTVGTWNILKSLDYGQPNSLPAKADKGMVPRTVFRVIRNLMKSFHDASAKDSVVAVTYGSVVMMAAPPFVLFNPIVILRVLRALYL